MSDQWYYARGENRSGPVTTGELRRLAAAGELVTTDLVWKEGMQKWVPANMLKGLFPSSAMPPPLPAERKETPAPEPLDPDPPAEESASARRPAWSRRERDEPNPTLRLVTAGVIALAVVGVLSLLLCLAEPGLVIVSVVLVGLAACLWHGQLWAGTLRGRWVPTDGSSGWIEFLSGGAFKREDGTTGTYAVTPNHKFIDLRVSGRRAESWKILVWDNGGIPFADPHQGNLEVQDSAGRVRTFTKGKTLAQKKASFFYVDRSTYLHGAWQPMTGTDEWVQFTEDGAVIFSNGSAGRYSMTGEEPNEVIEIEMVGGSQRQFKIVSLTSAQLVIAEGTDTTTFRRPGQAASRTGTADTGTTRSSGGAAKGVFGSLWAFLTRSKCPKCGQRAADQTKTEQISEVTQRVESEWVGGQLRQMVMNVWVERRTFCCEQCKHKWQEDHQCRRIA